MSFLQPWLLIALPLVALPIIIHLINQWRFQTIPWGAMMFLLSAQRMARGYSRLRQWLILLMRTLAVATLIFAVARPLASGWLGVTVGSQADTTLILLDRSPSMQQHGAGTGESKLDTGRHQLVRTLETLGSGRWVMIDSVTRQPRELESPHALLKAPSAGPASAPADLPALLQAAYDYVRDNRTGRTEIWICSDLHENDWNAGSGRWATLRDAFLELPQGVRFHLLAYPNAAAANTSVRVTNVRRQNTSDGAELLVSLRLSRQTDAADPITVPVQFEIEGARSVTSVELTGQHTDLRDHRIPIERNREQGWGRVSIPADANPADDEFYFAFADPPPRRAVVVVDNAQAELPLRLAAGISPDPALKSSTETLDIEQLTAVEWDQIGLVLWQASMPTGPAADLLQSFVARGGEVMLFPPDNPGDDELWSVRWQSWQTDNEPFTVGSWRGDDDLFGAPSAAPHCRSVSCTSCAIAAWPAKSRRWPPSPAARRSWHACPPSAAASTFGRPLPRRAIRRWRLKAWCCTPRCNARLSAGSSVLGKARQLNAGQMGDESSANWTRVSEQNDRLSTEAASQCGVYQAADRLLAVNRPAAEDHAQALADSRVDELFHGLNYVRVDDQAGNLNSLVQEIWRAFLFVMLVALIVEAVLCLPRIARVGGTTA